MRAGQRRCSRGRANRRRRTASARRNPAPPRPTRRLLMLWQLFGPSSQPCPAQWRRLAGTASSWKTILGRPSSGRHRPGLRTGSCEPTVSASGEQSGRVSCSRQNLQRCPSVHESLAAWSGPSSSRTASPEKSLLRSPANTRIERSLSAWSSRVRNGWERFAAPNENQQRPPAPEPRGRSPGVATRRGLGGLRGARRAGAGGARSARRAGAHRDASDQRAEQEDGHEEPGGRWLRGRRVGVNR